MTDRTIGGKCDGFATSRVRFYFRVGETTSIVAVSDRDRRLFDIAYTRMKANVFRDADSH